MVDGLVAAGVRRAVGGIRLVDDVDLEVGRGEVVVLIGPNGAGKSTLVALLAGDIRPDAGTIVLDGDDLSHLDPLELALRRSVVVQQDPTDVPFTTRRVIDMGRHPLRVTGRTDPQVDRAVVDALILELDLRRLEPLPVRLLSGGERRRVAIARALAQASPTLLLDEPAAALDVAHQEAVMRKLRETARGGVAVLCVLHDLNLAAAHADRIVVMHEGGVTASGVPDEVLTPDLLSSVYRHRFQVTRHPSRPCPLVIVED